MEKIKNYFTSEKGVAFQESFWFCWIGMAAMTFVMGALNQATTALLTNVPLVGFIVGLSNRMVPFGLAVCLMVLAMDKGRELWLKRAYSKDIILGAFTFSMCGFALGFGGF